MNVKKMFASLTGVLMLASVTPVSVLGAANYGAELTGAYEYAYSKGITTMNSIDSANMYGQITRGELAKMISNWAEKELGMTADATKVCSFTDANTAQGDLAGYLTKACQMGLMGQGITAFRPNDKVTRGEFGTTLSRAMWGTAHNGGEPFYVNHLNALKAAGVMNMIETPNQLEIRGYVMLMLQRAVAKATPGVCTAEMATVCANGGACPAACTNANNNTGSAISGVVLAGDLAVSVSTSTNTISIPSTGMVKAAELSFKASQDVRIDSLSVTRMGLSDNSNLKVWIEKDGKRISSTSSFFGDSKANVTFNGGYVVKSTDKLDLIVQLNGVAVGSEMSFKISDIVSSAKNLTVSPDTTGLYRTANYAVASLSVIPVNTTRSYDLAKDSEFTFAEFKLQNDSSVSLEKNILVRSVTFRFDGKDLANLSNFKVTRDGKALETTYSVSGRDLTVVFNDQIDSGRSTTYKLIATPTNIESENGDNYTVSIRRSQDVVAEEIGQNLVGFRVAVNGAEDAVLGKTTVKGGTITLTRDTNFPSVVNAGSGYSDVTLAKGTVKVNQDVKFEKGFALDGTVVSRVAGNTTANLKDVVRSANLEIAGRTYRLNIADTKVTTDSEIYLTKGTHNIALVVSLQNDPKVTRFDFNNISKDAFLGGRYVNNDDTKFLSSAIAGTVRVANLKVETENFGLKRTGALENVKVVKGNTDERVVFSGEISNTLDKNIEITQAVLNVVNDANVNTNIANAYVALSDGTTSRTVAFTTTNKDQTIDLPTISLEPGKSVKVEVRVMNNADNVQNAKYRFAFSLNGLVAGNKISTNVLNTVYVEVSGGATTTVVASSNDRPFFATPGAATDLAKFTYNVRNDSVEVNQIKLAVNGLATTDLDDVTVYFGKNITPAVNSYSVSNGELVVNFKSTTLPVDNYDVRVAGLFSEEAIPAATATAVKKSVSGAVKVVKVDGSSTDGTVKKEFYVTKAFPVLSLKSRTLPSGNSDNATIILNATKNSSTYEVVLNSINADPATVAFKNTANEDFTDVSLSTTPSEGKAVNAGPILIKSVTFTVKDGEGKVTKYENVNAVELGDFSAMSYEG